MYSKYLALLLVALQVAYAVPTPQAASPILGAPRIAGTNDISAAPAVSLAGSSPSASGCSSTHPSNFGITVVPISGASTLSRRTLNQIPDGQVQNSAAVQNIAAAPVAESTMSLASAPVEYSAPQFQAASVGALSQIPDGQVQNIAAAPVAESTMSLASAPVEYSAPQFQAASVGALSQIPDGQVQNIAAAPVAESTMSLASAPFQAASVGALSQIPEVQVQNVEAAPVQQYSAPQIQAASVGALSQIPDGQVQNIVRRQAPGNPSAGSAPLSVHLENGILRDSQGRQGYIADNYQFQFDAPPQATPYATSGFSACSDGNLALNGESTFYQCRSGDCTYPNPPPASPFPSANSCATTVSNIYDRKWAEHCEPVHLSIL
ncbi:hypothetical protein DFH27DRAFT_479918 [Peziza echinospora]|nr:hypothetical protein DFH27DRAFT_479918 [Peziza echinospora]